MNFLPAIVEVTPPSFEPLVQHTVVPVLLLAYKEESANGVALHSLFTEASLSPRGEALFARANLTQHPELARLIGVVAPASLTLYWAGEARYQFLGQCTRRELEEILMRAETYALSNANLNANPIVSSITAPGDRLGGRRDP